MARFLLISSPFSDLQLDYMVRSPHLKIAATLHDIVMIKQNTYIGHILYFSPFLGM